MITAPVSGGPHRTLVSEWPDPAGMFAHRCWCRGRIMIALVVSFALMAPGAFAQDSPEYRPGVVVVQFAPGIAIANKGAASGLEEFDRRAARYGVHMIERVYPFLDRVEPTPKTRRNLLALRRTYYVRYSAGAAPADVAQDLAAAAGVMYAEPVPVYRTQALHSRRVDPDDPRFGEQAELRLLRLPEAWDEVRGDQASPRVVIAVVDGGAEWNHEDLRANVWTNPGEVAGNGIDDDGNGFIDDVHGVNFANRDDADNDPTGLSHLPENSLHGTAAAGFASAVTDNGVGIAGAAWNAEIMHINAGDPFIDGPITFGFEGILYAAANGADIINVSWSGLAATDEIIRLPDQALELATDMGALVVAAAGNGFVSNDLFRTYPARHPRVLSVGATEKETRRRAFFSNYGRLVNVFAPGVDVLTTGTRDGYVTVEGTSFSSPLAAGVAALVKTGFPDMTPDALREQIRLTSDNMDAENQAMAGQLGRGFVNALAAVQMPSVPAVRLQRWSWEDDDGDHMIASGDAVTVTASVVNHLSDARQLSVGLVPAEPYSFIDMTAAEASVGYLAGGDSAEVRLEFRVAADAPAHRQVRFFTRIRDGTFEDGADMLTLGVNLSQELVHRSLSALYTATGGDNWTHNDNWDITRVPTETELATWAGVILLEGWLVELALPDNNLTGQLPPEIGNLPQLRRLDLNGNSLSGPIPPELGNLSQLRELGLSGNSLSGSVPPELGNLSQLRWLALFENSLTGVLPRSLMQLERLEVFYFFGDQELCAPTDGEFQTWLGGIPEVIGPACEAVQFADKIADQSFARAQPITPLVLPEATRGVAPITYALTPALPAGLGFDPSSRKISGTPTGVTTAPVRYTYTANDAAGSADSLLFSIEVYSPVDAEHETLPESFVVRGNHPNPFRQSTRLEMDLPWPSRVTVEVFDMSGRRVLTPPAVELAAGWARSLELRGAALSSGLYLYRVYAASPEGSAVFTSRFVRIR